MRSGRCPDAGFPATHHRAVASGNAANPSASTDRKPDVDGWFDLLARGSIEHIEHALRTWPDLANLASSRGRSPLMHVIGLGQCRLARLLCQHGADTQGICLHPDDEQSRAFVAALSGMPEGRIPMPDIVREAVCRYPVGEGVGRTPLTFAVAAGAGEELLTILATERPGTGASAAEATTPDLDVLDGLGQSALGVAIECHLERRARSPRDGEDTMARIALLVRLGASVNALASPHGTPLMQAARAGDADLVTWLIRHGAAAHQTSHGQSALGLAALRGHAHLMAPLAEAACAGVTGDPAARAALLEHAMVQAVEGDQVACVAPLTACLVVVCPDRVAAVHEQLLGRAVAAGRANVARWLLQNGATDKPASATRFRLVETSAHRGDEPTFRALWERWGAEILRMPAHRYRLLKPLAAAGWTQAMRAIVERNTDERNAPMRARALSDALMTATELACIASVRYLLPHVPDRVNDGQYRERLQASSVARGQSEVFRLIVESAFCPSAREAIRLVRYAAMGGDPTVLDAVLCRCEDEAEALGQALRQVDSSQGLALLLARGAGAVSLTRHVAAAIEQAFANGDGSALEQLLDTEAVRAMAANELARTRTAVLTANMRGGAGDAGLPRLLGLLDAVLARKLPA